MEQETLETERKRQGSVRRNVLLLTAISLAFYFGFIYMVYSRSP